MAALEHVGCEQPREGAHMGAEALPMGQIATKNLGSVIFLSCNNSFRGTQIDIAG